MFCEETTWTHVWCVCTGGCCPPLHTHTPTHSQGEADKRNDLCLRNAEGQVSLQQRFPACFSSFQGNSQPRLQKHEHDKNLSCRAQKKLSSSCMWDHRFHWRWWFEPSCDLRGVGFDFGQTRPTDVFSLRRRQQRLIFWWTTTTTGLQAEIKSVCMMNVGLLWELLVRSQSGVILQGPVVLILNEGESVSPADHLCGLSRHIWVLHHDAATGPVGLPWLVDN